MFVVSGQKICLPTERMRERRQTAQTSVKLRNAGSFPLVNVRILRIKAVWTPKGSSRYSVRHESSACRWRGSSVKQRPVVFHTSGQDAECCSTSRRLRDRLTNALAELRS